MQRLKTRLSKKQIHVLIIGLVLLILIILFLHYLGFSFSRGPIGSVSLDTSNRFFGLSEGEVVGKIERENSDGGEGGDSTGTVSDADNKKGKKKTSKSNSASNPVATEYSIYEAKSVKYDTEVFVENLNIPWSLVFTSNNRALVTERDGAVRLINNGKLQSKPFFQFSDLVPEGEAGLMGMVQDPNYLKNKYLYFCYSTTKSNNLITRVVRHTDGDTTLTKPKIVIDDIPAAKFHAGCELAFGPDGMLYITTGDASDKDIAQDLNSPGGKVLRINPNGSIPKDNPFKDSPIWSYGHRNPQGLAWYPGSSILYESEHGPTGFDGPEGGDEINIIKKGKNYGWPVVSHQNSAANMVDPKMVFTPAIAPSGIAFYTSDNIPEFQNNLFVAMLGGEGIMRFVINPLNREQILFNERLPIGELGRIRDIEVGSDGNLYFTTSNLDGRGTARQGDDKIYRIVRK